jgi:hypothetical protein
MSGYRWCAEFACSVLDSVSDMTTGLKITALSLILHCSTSGKSVGSSEHEHPGNYVLIRLRLASLVNLPVYMGLICDYQ